MILQEIIKLETFYLSQKNICKKFTMLQYVAIVLLSASWIISAAPTSENGSDQVVESNATSSNVSMKLDSKLRTALLKALSDLENEGNSENSDDTEERNVERANASAITIVEDDFSASPPSSADTKTETVSNNETPDSNNPSGEPSNEKAQSILFQKSNSLQSSSITTIEQSPLDPLKDAENIITSASNSFSTEGLNEPRSISKDSESHKGLDVSVNSVYNSEPTKSGRVTLVEKFSDEKAVDEPPFIQTYVKPLEQEANSEKGDLQKATEKPMEASTEENEAKVEQVQFFSAPLVAAFTVHQDETGHPNKVEPIYKNDNNIQPLMEPVNSVELSPVLSRNSFNSLSLQQKQQLLEQELQQLRVQQQQLFARNNFAAGSQVLSQTGFNQAINQNFNQLDPVFTEPDRSIVTKLASIDPNNLLAETADPFLSRFMPNEAIVPVVSAAQSLVNSNHPVDVSFTSSISFDPLAEAGKLPENAQILPVKEPTGFHKLQSFIQPSQPLSGKEASLGGGNFATSAYLRQEAEAENQNRILRQELGTANLGFNQNSFSIVPAQQPVPPKHELGYFPENSQFPGQNELRSQSLLNQQNTRLLTSNAQENRGGFSNVPTNNRFFQSSQSLGVQQSVQPFGSQPLSSNSPISAGNSQRFSNTNQNPVRPFNQPHRFTQNNRILRSNVDSTFLGRPVFFQTPVLQSYKYIRPFGFSALRLH
uniref:Uncharacterized protein n=1 Tax=Dendroctonus ponderosae TaxID=77166 RepID=A0AAR5PNY2_DENPD